MNLKHEPVVEAHLRHFGQHLRAEQIAFGSAGLPRTYLVEELSCLARREIRRRAVGWPWSEEVAPNDLKKARRLRCAPR